jgi:ABC-type transport system involved in multi-copper enzyme maturation permease subunit
MIQAYTVLLDSLRMLRASKLFWISICISALVALVYASIGFTPQGISFLFGLLQVETEFVRAGTIESETLYLLIFTDVIARFWLGWFSLPLATISTCSIFPQYLQSGSIEIALSKPISRLRLFLLKYLGGLLFVALQTLLFCIVAFLAIGIRLDEWSLSIFWAVPIITFSFSLIFCVGALIGIYTRSTVFALLGALLFWGFTLIVQWGEDFTYKMAYTFPEIGIAMDLQTGNVDAAAPDSTDNGWMRWNRVFQKSLTVLPKTRECTLSLKRLIHFRERESMLSGMEISSVFSGVQADPELRQALAKYEKRHTWFTLYGTSLLFELLMLGLAARVMIRRDY